MSTSLTVETTRFGRFHVTQDQIWTFPAGLIGFPTATEWLLLGEDEASPLVWIQSVSHSRLALPLISPRRYVRGYRVRVTPSELEPLQLDDADLLFVLTTVASTGTALTTDLRGPLLFNASKRLGVQAVACDEYPLQYVLPLRADSLKRSA